MHTISYGDEIRRKCTSRKAYPQVRLCLIGKTHRHMTTYAQAPVDNTPSVAQQQKYFQMRMQTLSISRKLSESIQLTMPGLTKEQLLFLVWLSKTRKRCKVTGGIKFSRNMYASILGVHPNTVRLTKFLQECKDSFLPDLEWKEHQFTEELCTTITNTGLQHVLDQLTTDVAEERVLVGTLRNATNKVKQRLAKRLKETVLAAHWLYEDQECVASYLNTLPYSIFSKGDFYAALKIATRLDTDIAERHPDSFMRNHHKSTLLAVRDMWKPFYIPLTKEGTKTPRIFGSELTFMPSVIRHALHPDWIDFDLKNCHLAIIAYLFDAPLTQKFLETGTPFWQEIMEYMGIEPEKRKQAKEFLKVALYSIVFGMNKKWAQENLEMDLGCRGIWWNKEFTKNSIVQEIAKVVDDAKKSIKENDGMKSAYGWIELGEDKVESILSCIVQSYELAIITSCYKLVMREKEARNNDFEIVLHQHDGFSIAPKEGVNLEAIERKLQKIVAAHTYTYGLSIEIEMKREGDCIH